MRAPSRKRSVCCTVCGAVFETRHSQGKYCSPECRQQGHRGHWHAYAERNRESRRKWHREHYAKNVEVVVDRTKRYHASEAGNRASQISGRRQRAKFPDKIAARQAVKGALIAGKLKKGHCASCGATKTEAHHIDYSRPLDVVWLCQPCHRKQHGRSIERPAQGMPL